MTMVDNDPIEPSTETTPEGDDAPRSQEPGQQTTKDPQSDPLRDNEGLLLEYDVVICGTGLVQSILASALTRAGKTVLHCDGSDCYGELDAVWSQPMIQDLWDQQQLQQQQVQQQTQRREELPQPNTDNNLPAIYLSPTGGTSSLRFHTKTVNQYFGIEIGTEVMTPYGNGIILSFIEDSQNSIGSYTSMQIGLNEWKLANGKSPRIFITIPSDVMNPSNTTILEEYLRSKEKIRSRKSMQAQELLTHHRFFALDATPSFVLASGPAVQGMLTSGVADYLEFKSAEGLYWLQKQEQTMQQLQQNDEPSFQLFRVPCSKNDVFGTKLLPPMDKRRLMKFIQVSMDYATKLAAAEELLRDKNAEMDDDTNVSSLLPSAESEVQSLNERYLNQGRSLARPQNKAVATNELQNLQQCIDQGGMTFDDFLFQHYNLSPKLRSIVRYALAWETKETNTSLADGMSTLRQHLQALGRYGTTAFLFPLYGSGELSQAFCRSAAVFGATYLLRRAPLAIQCRIEEEESNSVKMVDSICLSGERGVEEERIAGIPRETEEKVIKCSHVVVPNVALMNIELNGDGLLSQQRIARRLSIVSGMVIPSECGEQRHVVFIPPNSLGNNHAIHGALLDSSVCVAPKGCTLLHLTTTVTVQNGSFDDSADAEKAAAILERAERAILTSRSPDGNEFINKHYSTTLYHVSFSYCCDQVGHRPPGSVPKGLYICSHTGQSLTADAAFQQAEQIFSSICPGKEFLQLATSFDEAIRERAEEKRYDDDEKMMLESALGMIKESSEHADVIDDEIANSELPPYV